MCAFSVGTFCGNAVAMKQRARRNVVRLTFILTGRKVSWDARDAEEIET